MVTEFPALKLELNPHSLPFVRPHIALCFTIGEAGLNSLDHVAKFFRDHSKQEDHTLFVHGLVTKASKIYGIPIDWTTLELHVSLEASARVV